MNEWGGMEWNGLTDLFSSISLYQRDTEMNADGWMDIPLLLLFRFPLFFLFFSFLFLFFPKNIERSSERGELRDRRSGGREEGKLQQIKPQESNSSRVCICGENSPS